MPELERMIVDHGRQPRKYHTRILILLLTVILICLLFIALHGERIRIEKEIARLEMKKGSDLRKIAVMKEEVLTLTMRHIVAQMIAESRGDHGAVSSKGCIGSMQVNPATAAEYGIREWELYHPVLGLEAGIRIMNDLWERWRPIKNPMLRWSLALASYNCGHSRAQLFYYGMGLRMCGIRTNWVRFLPRQTLVYIIRVTNHSLVTL